MGSKGADPREVVRVARRAFAGRDGDGASPPSTSRTRRSLSRGVLWFTSAVLALAVGAAAVREGPALLSVLRDVQPGWAGLGLGFLLVSYALRGLRIVRLSRTRVRWWPEGVQIACVHGVLAYLLPVRSGDLSLPAVMRGVAQCSWVEGAQVLVRARVLDLCAVGVWILLVGGAAYARFPRRLWVAWMVCGALLAAAPKVVKALAAAVGWFRPRGLLRHLENLVRAAQPGSGSCLVSVGIWGAIGASLYATARAVGLPLEFSEVWLVTTIQLPLQLVPLQGVANTGTHEAGWVAGLLLLGIPAADGLRFALATHSLLLLYVLALIPVALVARARHRARN